MTSRIGHRADILTIQENEKYIVTGSADGFISVWNIITGLLKSSVKMSDPLNENERNKQIQRR